MPVALVFSSAREVALIAPAGGWVPGRLGVLCSPCSTTGWSKTLLSEGQQKLTVPLNPAGSAKEVLKKPVLLYLLIFLKLIWLFFWLLACFCVESKAPRTFSDTKSFLCDGHYLNHQDSNAAALLGP